MVHKKEHLLLIGKSRPCGGSGFSLSLSEWSFTMCSTPYNRKSNVLSASLNRNCPSFLHDIWTISDFFWVNGNLVFRSQCSTTGVCAILSVGWCI